MRECRHSWAGDALERENSLIRKGRTNEINRSGKEEEEEGQERIIVSVELLEA